jgi:hypothetical protein
MTERSEAVARMIELRDKGRAQFAAEMARNQAIARAWDSWITSEEGEKCMSEGAFGEYLRNRLWWAFMAGAATSLSSQGDSK